MSIWGVFTFAFAVLRQLPAAGKSLKSLNMRISPCPMRRKSSDNRVSLWYDQYGRSRPAPYFAGDITLDEAVQNIQSRVELYLGEQK